ncbi:MAG: GNAT family N-acetyltransferase [Eubacteriales bacterium]|nr:GNAT family N-acetyltransferase [Eubacteriales bacterium]
MKKKLFSEIPYLTSQRLVLRKIVPDDAPGLTELVNSPNVYRYLPTFLFEKKYDVETVIERLYDECFKASIILGIFMDGEFCGLAEFTVSVMTRIRSAWDTGFWSGSGDRASPQRPLG